MGASTSEEGERERVEEDKSDFYVLREKPTRSSRLVDHEFFNVGSIVLHNRESETESSHNPSRQRSKKELIVKEKKGEVATMIESLMEHERVSSTSNSTIEKNVAFCLMLLSRDKWKGKEEWKSIEEEEEEEEEEAHDESHDEWHDSDEFRSCNYNKRARRKYKCATCHKAFKSYQALGGHRASHKKEKLHDRRTHNHHHHAEPWRPSINAAAPPLQQAKKIHECPYCSKVFSSGQALGGHKRSHVARFVATTNPTSTRSSLKLGDNLSMIDLNLPAPVEHDNISQIEFSKLSDSDFVNHIIR